MPDATSPEPANRKQSGKESQRRKQALDEMRRQQARKEQRKTGLYIAGAVLVALAVFALAAVPLYLNSRKANEPLEALGVTAAAASCDAEIVDQTTGESQHVDPGTRIDYDTAPPASGRHEGEFLRPPASFYTPEDSPTVEKLVHSLEHGHLIAWYDPALPEDQREALESIATKLGSQNDSVARGYFIAAPWPGAADQRDPLPEGKSIALTRWGGQNQAWRQYCGQVSGEAIKNFSEAHPPTDAPEAGAI